MSTLSDMRKNILKARGITSTLKKPRTKRVKKPGPELPFTRHPQKTAKMFHAEQELGRPIEFMLWGGPVSHIARQLGIPRQTVYRWRTMLDCEWGRYLPHCSGCVWVTDKCTQGTCTVLEEIAFPDIIKRHKAAEILGEGIQ